MKKIILGYLAAFIVANLLVKHFGMWAVLFNSFVLIPFDFIARCIMHERWRGKMLVIRLFLLTTVASYFTIMINYDARWIALASVVSFTAAQLVASIFYQLTIQRSYFLKVNGSDFLAIIVDSIIFQLIAFAAFNPALTFWQVVVKVLGGLVWYYIIFKTTLHERLFNGK